jgi:hypothetical protein
VSPATLISSHRTIQAIDFSAVTTEELKSFDIDFVFKIDRTGKTADDAFVPTSRTVFAYSRSGHRAHGVRCIV